MGSQLIDRLKGGNAGGPGGEGRRLGENKPEKKRREIVHWGGQENPAVVARGNYGAYRSRQGDFVKTKGKREGFLEGAHIEGRC